MHRHNSEMEHDIGIIGFPSLDPDPECACLAPSRLQSSKAGTPSTSITWSRKQVIRAASAVLR